MTQERFNFERRYPRRGVLTPFPGEWDKIEFEGTSKNNHMDTATRRKLGHAMLDIEEAQEQCVRSGDYERAITLHAAIDSIAHALAA